jgi:membrane protease YdiL (CAAX protease family)
VTVFPIGLMFGWAAWKTNSIWTGVFAHMLNNSIAVVLGFYVTDEHTGKVLTYVLLPLSAIVLAFSILLLVKMKKPPKQDEFIGFPVQ